MDSVDGGSLNPFEAEEDVSVETFEEFCLICEKGKYGSVNETLLSNVQAETLWINDRRPRSMATPISIATTWGHTNTVEILLHSGANPMLKTRCCKKDWCRHAYPTTPGTPCPGYLDPEHPDDSGDSALQIAKNRGHLRIIEIIKNHIFNCVNHSECINYKRECPEDMLGLVRDTPLDDPLLLYPAPMPKETILNPNPLPPWPLKHHGQVFRACSEGDVVLVKRLIREWKEAKELEDDDDEPTDEVLMEAKRPDPVTARHPVTHETLLHLAAKQPNPDMIQFLLDVGADIKANDKWSTSAFWYACHHGRFANAKLLASNLPVNDLRRHQARAGNTPSHAAAANKHYELSHWVNHEIARRFKKGT